MTRTEMQIRIRALREELETRTKDGTVKIADANGQPVSTETLQNELYKLIYRCSKME